MEAGHTKLTGSFEAPLTLPGPAPAPRAME